MGSRDKASGKGIWARLHLGNVLYHSVLTSLMIASAAFPFYVHFHQAQFGPPEMKFYGASEMTNELQPSSPVYQRKVVAFVKPRLELDRMATGTIARARTADRLTETELTPNQPFPDVEPVSDPMLEIMFVGAGRILAVDQGKLVTLRQGSLLADGSQIKSIEKADGGWMVATSSGRTLTWTPNQ